MSPRGPVSPRADTAPPARLKFLENEPLLKMTGARTATDGYYPPEKSLDTFAAHDLRAARYDQIESILSERVVPLSGPIVDSLLWRILEERKDSAEKFTNMLYERLRNERIYCYELESDSEHGNDATGNMAKSMPFDTERKSPEFLSNLQYNLMLSSAAAFSD